jgi:hypothetical protein
MDRRFRLGAIVATALLAVVVGVTSYNAGISHGLAVAPAAAAVAQGQTPAAAVPMPPYYYGYGWYRPWGWGFHFFPFGLFGLFFFFLLFRFAFGWGRGWRRRGYYGGPHDVPMAFDEWHRRAHERMTAEPSTPPRTL